MATEEITISELELADEVLADMVMAVETASDTKAITLKQLKAYLGSNLPTGFILPAVGRISDERFTLLDGKTLAKAGGYEAFYNKVQSEVEKGNWYACTEEEYNSDISTYGQCGRFVLTAEYVRIPKITRFLGATVTLSEIGKTYKESLPNITGTFYAWNGNLSGAFYKQYDTVAAAAATDSQSAYINFDASRSSSTYQNGAKVQPDHTRYPYYMVVSTEGQTANIEIDINKVYEDMNLKANTTLSNVSNVDSTFKEASVGWGMPDYSAGIDIKSTAINGYTTPKQGQCFVRGNSNTDIKIYINNVLVMVGSTPNSYPVPWTFDIDKGEVLKIQNAYEAKFFPLKGVN